MNCVKLYEDMMSENAKMKNELERLQRDLASARTRLNPPSASASFAGGRSALSPARPPLPYTSTSSASGVTGSSAAAAHPHHHRELHAAGSVAGAHSTTGSDSDIERHSLEHKIRQYEEELQVN